MFEKVTYGVSWVWNTVFMRHATVCFLGLTLAACSAASNDDPNATGAGGSAVDDNTGVGGSANAAGAMSNGASGATSSGGSSGVAGSGTGGSGSGTGGTANAGGSSGRGGGSVLVDGGVGVAAKCETPKGPGLPAGAPVLTKGTWKDISPAGVNIGTGPIFTQGMAVNPCDPAVLYLTVSAFDSPSGGLFKSIDAGSTWRRVAKVTSGVGYIDEPIPCASTRKTRSTSTWVTVFAGAPWASGSPPTVARRSPSPRVSSTSRTRPTSSTPMTSTMWPFDPTDFNHVLLSFHSMWGDHNTKWKGNRESWKARMAE